MLVGTQRARRAFERSQRLVEGLAEFGQVVEGGGLDPAGVEMTQNQAVAFSPSERVSEHLVRNAIERIVEVLVAAISVA